MKTRSILFNVLGIGSNPKNSRNRLGGGCLGLSGNFSAVTLFVLHAGPTNLKSLLPIEVSLSFDFQNRLDTFGTFDNCELISY